MEFECPCCGETVVLKVSSKKKLTKKQEEAKRFYTTGMSGEDLILFDGRMAQHGRITKNGVIREDAIKAIKLLAKREGVSVKTILGRWGDWIQDVRDDPESNPRYVPNPVSLFRQETLTSGFLEGAVEPSTPERQERLDRKARDERADEEHRRRHAQ